MVPRLFSHTEAKKLQKIHIHVGEWIWTLIIELLLLLLPIDKNREGACMVAAAVWLSAWLLPHDLWTPSCNNCRFYTYFGFIFSRPNDYDKIEDRLEKPQSKRQQA